jgi:hypothetical protein
MSHVVLLGLVLNEGKADVLPNEAVHTNGRWHTTERKIADSKAFMKPRLVGSTNARPYI